MKRIISIIGILFASVAVLSAAEKGDTLKIMCYNLRFGELASMEQIAEYISSEQPDIVAVQECDWDSYRSKTPHQHGVKFINVLAYNTGMFGVYAKAINHAGGYYGNGLLSKYPILKYERVLLPNDGKSEQRCMLVADIELPDGRIITFVNTHLEVKKSEMRVEQVNFINEYLKDCPNQIFLAGDMNALPDTEEMALLRKVEDQFTEATSGNKAWAIKFSADYQMSKALTLRLFYDKQINTPLISTSYPTSNSNFGVTMNFSLTR